MNPKFRVGDFIRELNPSEWKKQYPNDCGLILAYCHDKDCYSILFINGFTGIIEYEESFVFLISREVIDKDYNFFDKDKYIVRQHAP